jgi:hypothetical protein
MLKWNSAWGRQFLTGTLLQVAANVICRNAALEKSTEPVERTVACAAIKDKA